jgi:hypothetical protein
MTAMLPSMESGLGNNPVFHVFHEWVRDVFLYYWELRKRTRRDDSVKGLGLNYQVHMVGPFRPTDGFFSFPNTGYGRSQA